MAGLRSLGPLVRGITVEPVLLLYMMSSYMEFAAFQSLVYAKVCEEQFSASVCASLDLPAHSAQQSRVQQLASGWVLRCNVALAVLSMLSAVYIGTWSDLLGRKLPLLLPPLGMILCALLFMAIAAAPAMSVGWVVVANALVGCLGGFNSGMMTMMTYLSAVTAAGQRTLRLGLLEAMSFVGGFCGPLLGAAVADAGGRTWTFCTLIMLNTLVVVYVVVRLPEVPPPRPPPPTATCTATLASLFSLRHFWEALRTAVRARPEGRRLHILVLLVCALVIMLNTSGEQDVTYLYLRDPPLSQSDLVYSGYLSMQHALGAATLMLGLPLVKRLLEPSDLTLCAVGIVSKALGLVWLAFTVNRPMLFVAPVVAMFNTFSIPPVRSQLSKLVEPEEQGRAMALLTIVQNACTLLGSALYNGVYPATRQQLHGLVFLLGAGTLLLPGLLVCLLRSCRPQPPAVRLQPAADTDDPAPAQGC